MRHQSEYNNTWMTSQGKIMSPHWPVAFRCIATATLEQCIGTPPSRRRQFVPWDVSIYNIQYNLEYLTYFFIYNLNACITWMTFNSPAKLLIYINANIITNQQFCRRRSHFSLWEFKKFNALYRVREGMRQAGSVPMHYSNVAAVALE